MSEPERVRRDAYVRAVVDSFPPLTQAQRARVSGLLAPVAATPPTARAPARRRRQSAA